MKDLQDLLVSIARVGREHPSYPRLQAVEPFKHFFDERGSLKRDELDNRDGSCTRRELLTRYLLLNAVLDQGPDIIGLRDMLVAVVNSLYQYEIRILHRPLSFFEEIGISVDEILSKHESVKAIRKAIWAKDNNVQNPDKYNLFMDNSTQVLSYAVFRWGVPLALPLLLEKDCGSDDTKKAVALTQFIHSHGSAELMSTDLKDNERYGLGKAIGDKACHLFAKWVCTSFGLVESGTPEWGPFSYEVPFDSNAGRVLWRTGFFLRLARLEDYRNADVIRVGAGKAGTDYLRITNVRGIGCSNTIPDWVKDYHAYACTDTLRTHSKRPQKVQVQRVPHALLLEQYKSTGLGVADLDEGLIRIGTGYCFNHDSPNCKECPISSRCTGFTKDQSLIAKYRT